MPFNRQEITLIKSSVENHIARNESKEKITITVAQCLLMVIDSANKNNLSDDLSKRLKLLYLNGIKSEKEYLFIEEITSSFKDKNYEIAKDPKSIYLDPSRRYFESHLAYNILEKNASEMDHTKLKTFSENLYNFFLKTSDSQNIRKIDIVLHKIATVFPDNKYDYEYSTLIRQLEKHDYHGLSAKACDNLCEIAKSTILSTYITRTAKTLPGNIYRDSIFSMGIEGRGRSTKKETNGNKSVYKGLMLSINPVPLDDITINRTKKDGSLSHSPELRSADQANFMIESKWNQEFFSRQTQVFSNGISSTTLAQLRNILTQKRLGNLSHSEYLKKYITVYASLMLFNSGGHGLFEIFEVLKIPQFKEIMEASNIDHLIDNDELMSTFLYEDQKDSFNAAITEAISFNQQIIKRRIMMSQIEKKYNGNTEENNSENNSPENLTLHQAVLTLNVEQFNGYLDELKDKNLLREEMENRNLALMLAVQSGKLEHAKQLLENGADINFKFESSDSFKLNMLDIAVKNNQQHIVEHLLKNYETNFPIIIEKSERQPNLDDASLRAISPSLYLASRSNNSFILNQLLENKSVSLNHKLLALQEAIGAESLPAINTMISNLSLKEELPKINSEHKYELIKKAIRTGNIQLVNTLLESKLYKNFELPYKEFTSELLNTGYFPMIIFFREKILNNEDNQKEKIDLFLQAKNQDKENILHLAVKIENENFIQELLNSIKEPETKYRLLREGNAHGETASHIAVKTNNEKIIQTIITAFQDPKIQFRLLRVKNIHGENVLHLAAREGNEKATQAILTYIKEPKIKHYLLTSGNNSDEEKALHVAARHGNEKVIQTILTSIESPETKHQLLEIKNNRGENVLHIAARHKNEKVIQAILTLIGSSEINHQLLKVQCRTIKFGYEIVLNIAAKNKNEKVVQAILTSIEGSGIKNELLKAKNRDGKNILHSAATNNNEKVIQEILTAIKDPEIKRQLLEEKTTERYNSENVLHIAAKNGNEKIIQAILTSIEEPQLRQQLLETKNKHGESVLQIINKNKNTAQSIRHFIKDLEMNQQSPKTPKKHHEEKEATDHSIITENNSDEKESHNLCI